MAVDSIANFPLRGTNCADLGIALGRCHREFLVWYGQAAAIEQFPSDAKCAGVETVIAGRNEYGLELAKSLGILKWTDTKVLDNCEISKELAGQQIVMIDRAARTAAVVMLHSAIERSLWRLVRFGMIAERSSAIERVARRQVTVQELCDIDRDTLLDQRLENWWEDLERGSLLHKWDALIGLFGNPDNLRDGDWYFNREMLLEFDNLRHNCVHHGGQLLKDFNFTAFARQLWRAQWVWLATVALRLKVQIPGEALAGA